MHSFPHIPESQVVQNAVERCLPLRFTLHVRQCDTISRPFRAWGQGSWVDVVEFEALNVVRNAEYPDGVHIFRKYGRDGC